MRRPVLPLAFVLLGIALGAQAAEPVHIQIKGQAFLPAEFNVPAGEKVQLVISNLDELPAEFESTDLSREIVVPAHGQVKVYIGPLDAGRYRFFNDSHQSAEGWVTAVAAPK